MSEKTSRAGAPVGAEAPPEVPARWSAARKTDGDWPTDLIARQFVATRPNQIS